MQRVTLIQTSDLHGKFPLASQERLTEIREREKADFLVDSGDIIKAGNLGLRLFDPMWDIYNRLGYTAAAIGNREAHVWRALLAQKISPAQFPLLCANLKLHSGTLPLQSHLIRETTDGVCIAFFGLTVPMITQEMWSRHLSDLLFLPPQPVAQECVARLRPEADLIVLLSHLGLKEDRRLAQSVPGIDLILGGHSHIELHEPERVGNTVICQPGGFGKYATLAHCFRESDEEKWAIEAHLEPLREEVHKGSARKQG